MYEDIRDGKNLCFDKLTIEEGQTATVKTFVHDVTSKDEVEMSLTLQITDVCNGGPGCQLKFVTTTDAPQGISNTIHLFYFKRGVPSYRILIA